MTTRYATGLAPVEPAECASRVSAAITPRPPEAPGSWRYDRARMSRPMIAVAALLSVSLHAALFFGVGHAPKKIQLKQERVIAITLAIPNLKDLEEPEPPPTDEATPATDLATLVPMQADLPQIPQPNDFVQAINFSSLLDKPDLSNVALTVIPDAFRGGQKIAERIGKIFNLEDLDRIPEPVLQHAPIYPHAQKRDGVTGQVQVQFVVDTEGRVLDAHVVATTDANFNDAAVAAVSKWKFRPGSKGGRKVNTRMGVPMVFALADQRID